MASNDTQIAHPLDTQVGGHVGGMQTTEDGSLVIKRSSPTERAFYQAVGTLDVLSPLREHIPEFIGILTETSGVNASPTEAQVALTGKDMFIRSAVGLEGSGLTSSSQTQSLVLKNVCYPFIRPNILDIKLGTVLYDQNATQEKKARMIRVAQETTSLKTGMRLTGFQIWSANRQEFEHISKAYGKSINASQLPEGIRKFFPLEAVQDCDLLSAVIEGIIQEIQAIRKALERLEVRMVGASLLIAWEGDEEALKQCILSESSNGDPVNPGNGVATSDDDDGDGDGGSDESEPEPPLAFVVKLIDFAHTHIVSGEGPDVGVLLGIDTTLKLLQGRKSEVEAVGDRLEPVTTMKSRTID